MLHPMLSRRQVLQAGSLLTLATMIPGGARAEGRTLRVSSFSDLQVLDPAFFNSSQELNLVELTNQRLIAFRNADSTSWELDAAESIDQLDDTHIKFTLKKGIKWTGGYGEVTAEDVKFSFERVADPKMQSPYASDWSALDHVEVVDGLTGVIVLKSYSAILWTIALPGWSGFIVCKKAVEALPEKRYTTAIPASSGPYVLTDWKPKQQTVFERNADWSGDAGPWERIVVVPIEDPKSSELAFDAREIDFSRLSLGTLARYNKQGATSGCKILQHPSIAYVWLGMNADNEALKDIRVRQAIQMATDADSAIAAAYEGLAARAFGIIAPSLLGHRTKNLVSYDPDRAKSLLKQTGVSGLSLTLDTLNDSQRLTMAQVIQDSLKNIGIEVTIRPRDSGVFNTLGDQKSGDSWKTIQLILNRFSMSPDPSFATEWFTPEQVGIWNWERFNSAEFGKLNDAAMIERDMKKRADMYVRMQDLMEESGQYVFLTHELRAYEVRDSVSAVLKPDGEPMLRRFTPA
jgi:peptide/nickel transport system substrate-binding protein